ncbi:transposase [Nitrosopumilus ureiphilus]|uniref:Transposase n=1 Tax=Nitrosopumilus ureiphilus TaxID=1470067 RepID=A0A7D5RHH5_9ARCH|nr:transposase [Nitrosopumilus ureiphilus]
MRLSDYHYHVHSQTSNRDYDVIKTGTVWTCNCADHKFRHVCCKHIHAVEFSLEYRKEVREQNKVILSPITVNSCSFCHSQSIAKAGIRHNKSGDIQRFSCQDCKKTFSINLGFEKMKNSPEAITNALQLYFTGESLRNVQKFLKLQGVNVSHKTVYKWIVKYTRLMKEHLNKITPQVGDAWRADEVYTRIRGEMKYVFSLMDDETRFWIAQEVLNRKEGADASSLFRLGKEITQTKPKVIITDGLHSYSEAYRKEFWTVQRENRTIHIRNVHLQGDMNNNKMERLNGEFRDREKVVRGIKKVDSVIIDGYQLYHNYVRPHMALEGKTPADLCGIDIKGDNKWMTLIQNASL